MYNLFISVYSGNLLWKDKKRVRELNILTYNHIEVMFVRVNPPSARKLCIVSCCLIL